MSTRAAGWMTAFGVGLAGLFPLPVAAQAPAGTGLKVAVVDVSVAIRTYNKTKDLEARIKAKVEQEDIQLKALLQEIKDKEDQLKSKLTTENPEVGIRLQIELAGLKATFNARNEWKQQLQAREMGQAMRQLFDEVKAAIDEQATKGGYDLVVQVLEPIPPGSNVNVLEEITRRQALFVKKDTVPDLTKKVVDALNDKYKPADGGTPPPPPSGTTPK